MSRIRILFAALAVVWLAACGGGSSGETPESPPPGGGQPPAAYTAAQRAEITARIAIQYEKLLEAHDPAPWETLRAYTLQQPEISAAGVGDGVLWARFTDGRHFVYVDNWTAVPMPEADAAGARPLQAAEPPPQRRALAAAATASAPNHPQVPASDRAIFLKLTHEDFAYADGLIRRMQDALRPRGWKFDSERVLSVDSLKNLQGQGFVFLNSHAALYGEEGSKRFGIMTETFSSDDFEAAYKPDLDDGSLIYARSRSWMVSHYGREYGLWGGTYPRYVATDTFVRKYMSFAPNSLVVLMMCNSGADKAAALRQAFLDVNAGAVMAWDGSANPMGYPAVEALVDRMTGANRPVRRYDGVLNPPLVPQRAFEYADVATFLDKQGLLDQPAIEGTETTRIRFFGDRFALLNPVITALRATGRDKLILHGRFGSRPEAAIMIGGHPVAVDRWAADGSEIEVTLPTGPNDPPGSKGEVVVTVQSRSSNVRVLGSWRGDVEYMHEEIYGAEPDVFRNRSTLRLHLRADAHAMRTEVDGPLLDNPYLISMASDTRIDWVADGGCADCHLFQSWSGSKTGLEPMYNIDASSPYPPDYSQPMVNAVFGAIQATSGQLQLYAGLGQFQTFTVTSHETPVRTHQAALRLPDQTLFATPRPPGSVGGLTQALALPFAWQQDIGAEKRERLVQGGSSDSAPQRHTIRWSAINASPAFDDRIGR
jgi:hypothetical protein